MECPKCGKQCARASEKSWLPGVAFCDCDTKTTALQYKNLREKYPDKMLLFRHNGFYEAYKEDAEKASRILGITLNTSSWQKDLDGQPIKMTGFPKDRLDVYLPKLVRAGERIAICDLLQD